MRNNLRHISGYRNKHHNTLNYVWRDSEGNPKGMTENPTNKLSANFGDLRPIQEGGCYKGDGQSYVEIPTIKDENFNGLTEFTVCLYAKEPYFNTYGTNLCGTLGTSPSRGFCIGRRGLTGYLQFIIPYDSNNYINVISTVAEIDQDIKFISGVFKGGEFLKLYVNGKIVAINTQNIPLEYNGSNVYTLKLFSRGNAGIAEPDTQIFNVSIYDKALTTNEIELVQKNSYITKGLLAQYKCNEKVGDISYDSSGNGHHGQIVNAITSKYEDNPNTIHQKQDIISFGNIEGFNDRIKTATWEGDFNESQHIEPRLIDQKTRLISSIPAFYVFDTSLQMKDGTKSGKYTDENVEDYMLWISTSYGQGVISDIERGEFELDFQSNGDVRVMLGNNNAANEIGSFVSNKGIISRKPIDINTWYNDANTLQTDKDELNLLLSKYTNYLWHDLYPLIEQPTINYGWRIYYAGYADYDINRQKLIIKFEPTLLNTGNSSFPAGTARLTNVNYMHFSINSLDNTDESLNKYMKIYGIDIWDSSNKEMVPASIDGKTDALGNDLLHRGKVPFQGKFGNSYCYKNENQGTHLKMKKPIVFLTNTNWEISFQGYCTNGNALFGNTTNSGNYLGLFTNGTIALKDNTGIIHSLIYTNHPSYEKYLSLKIVKYGTSIETFQYDEDGIIINRNMIFGVNPEFTLDQIGIYLFTTSYTFKGRLFNVRIVNNGIEYHWPLCEKIFHPTYHRFHNVANNNQIDDNHLTLTNGNESNFGYQDLYHYLQNGFNFKTYKKPFSNSYATIAKTVDISLKYNLVFIIKDINWYKNVYLMDTRLGSEGKYIHISMFGMGKEGNISSNFTGDFYLDGVQTRSFKRDGNYHVVEVRNTQFTLYEQIFTLFARYTYEECLSHIAFFEMTSEYGNVIISYKDAIDNLNYYDVIFENNGIIIPKKKDVVSDVYGMTLSKPQDNTKFLKSENTLNINGQTFGYGELINKIGQLDTDNIYFDNSTSESITNITLFKDQLKVDWKTLEQKLRNVTIPETNWIMNTGFYNTDSNYSTTSNFKL